MPEDTQRPPAPKQVTFSALPLQSCEHQTGDSEPTTARTHITQNTGNDQWFTPSEILEAARECMGGIDLDPASSPVANKTVQATRFFTAEDDGLLWPWRGRIWLNPPYRNGLVDQFINKLLQEVALKQVTQAILLLNNATETRWGQRVLSISSCWCFPASRIRFLTPAGAKPGVPLQGQMLLGVGCSPERFAASFASLGVTRTFELPETTGRECGQVSLPFMASVEQ